MPSNDKKIDNNCVVSFQRAKRDIYALRDEQQEQAALLSEVKSMKLGVYIKNEDLQAEMDKMLDLIKLNNDRITEVNDRVTQVWEYSESVKASTTRAATSLKKLKAKQLKLAKLATASNSNMARKVKNLNKRMVQKTAQINAIKAESRKLNSQVRSTAKFAQKVVAKKSKKSNSDRNQVNVSQDHEMKYILKKFGKKQSAQNVEALRKSIKRFKATRVNNDREHVYNFLEGNKQMSAMA